MVSHQKNSWLKWKAVRRGTARMEGDMVRGDIAERMGTSGTWDHMGYVWSERRRQFQAIRMYPPPRLHPCLNMKLYSPRCWTSPEQWNVECGCILHPFPSMQSQVTALLLANTGQHPGPILFHSAARFLAPFHRLLCAPPSNAASLCMSPLAFLSWSKSGSLSPLNGVFAQTSLPWTLFQISSMESRVWPP